MSFINLIDDTFIFNPTQDSDIADYLINITISDGQPLSNSQAFNLSVIKFPPIWLNTSLSDVKMKMNDFVSF